MAAPNWQEAVARQAEEVSARLRDVLSAGVGLLRTELGLQLPPGLEPQRFPSWLVLLLASFLALLPFLGLLWARRKRPGRAPEVGEEDEEEDAASVGLTAGGGPSKEAPAGLLKGEEQKKRNKKKPPEKTGRVSITGGSVQAAGTGSKHWAGRSRSVLDPALQPIIVHVYSEVRLIIVSGAYSCVSVNRTAC